MNLLRTFWQSQIGKKIVMAVTGLIGVGFVIGHMIGNLQVFQGPEKINAYGYFLKHTVGGALWVVRGVLVASVVLHAVAAYQLSRQRLAARPVGYKKGSQWEVSTVASRTIRWGGVLLLAFIVFHILHFTTLDIFPDYSETDVYGNVIKGFSHWWVTLFYVVAMASLALHLYHGAWSSARTLGAVKPSRNPLRHRIAGALAIVVALGFLVVPLAVFFGFVRPAPATTAAATASPSTPASK